MTKLNNNSIGISYIGPSNTSIRIKPNQKKAKPSHDLIKCPNAVTFKIVIDLYDRIPADMSKKEINAKSSRYSELNIVF